MDTSEKSSDLVTLDGSDFKNELTGPPTDNRGETKPPTNQPTTGDQEGTAPQQQGLGHYPPQGYPGEAQAYPHGDGNLEYPHAGPTGRGYPQNPQASQHRSEYLQNLQTGQPRFGYPYNLGNPQNVSGYPQYTQTAAPGGQTGPQGPQDGPQGSGYPQGPQDGQQGSGYPQGPLGQPPGINQAYNTATQYPGQQPNQRYPQQPYYDPQYRLWMLFNPEGGWQPGPPPYRGHGYPQQQQQQDGYPQQQLQQHQEQDGQQQHQQQHGPATPPPTYDESMVIVEPQHEKTFIKDQRKKEEMIKASRQQDEVSAPPDEDPPRGEEEIRDSTLDMGEGTPVFCVEVRGLPTGVSSDSISLYFENKRKSGGGSVSRVEMVGDRVARVYFPNIDAVKRVLAKNDHKISSHLVEVLKYPPGPSNTDTPLDEENMGNKTFEETTVYQKEQSVPSNESKGPDNSKPEPEVMVDDVQVDTIVVKGADGIPEDTVSLYFENKRKSGGGDIKEIVSIDSGDLLIIFEDPAVVERVLSKDHKLNDQALDVSLYTPPPSQPQPQPEVPEGPPDTIVVQNCGSITDDTLVMYFENHRSGGGDVRDSRRVGDDTVHITFELPEVVESVLQKAPHQLNNQDLDVSVYFPVKVSTEPPPPPATVLVQGCGGLNQDVVEMYFENVRRSGGGELESVTRGDNHDEFLVTFKDPEIAAAVSIGEHNFGGMTFEVSLVQQNDQSESTTTSQSNDQCWASSSDEDEEDDLVYVLKVEGVTEEMTEDTLELFFENRRRSGGGEIECMELDRTSETLLVYFLEPNVVKRVCQKAPLLLNKKQLVVSPYLPSTQQEVSQESPLKGLKDGIVVMISGFDSATSDDTLELYFENKRRSGGEDIQEIRTVETEEGCVKYIVYNSSEVAERVASKKHTVDGKKIQASLYKAPTPPPPQPKYPDKFLIRGLKESTSKDVLVQYMKDKLDCQPQKLVFGDEPGTVLVTADSTDMKKKLKKMKKIVKKRPLQGAFLSLSSVRVSNCVLVSGLDKKTNETTLSLYFESKKSGNVEETDVEKVVMVEDSNEALVYFTDHKVIQSVLDKPHRLDKRNLKTSLYTECLGMGGGQKDPMWFKLPKPLTIKDLDPYKLKFIKDSTVNNKNLEKQMEAGGSRIRSMSDNSVTLECILTKGTPDARKKVKNWKKEAEDDITHFLDLLITEKLSVLQEVWTDVMEQIKVLKMPRPEAATLFVFDESNQIFVVGHKMHAEGILKQIKEKVTEVENVHERKKKEITETVTNQKPMQLRLLMASGFHRTMMEKYDGMSVDINIGKNEITFIGLMFDVKNARINMYESCTNYKETTVTMSDAQIQFVMKKPFRDYLVTKLKQKNLCGVWEEVNGKLRVLARSDPEVANVAHMVKQSACQQDIDLDFESGPLLTSPLWKQLCDTQKQNKGELVRIIPAADKSKIILVATDDLIASLAEDVNNFIKDNTVYEETVKFPKGIQRFMVKHFENEIKKLETKFQSYFVEIKFRRNSTEFTVRGTKDGLQIVTSDLIKVSRDVTWKKHVFDKPGIAKLIQSDKGDSHIFNIESTERCMIEKSHDETEQVSFGNRKRQRILQTATGGPQVVATCDLGSGHKLHVSQGDITKMQVGAVVNAANQQLAHIGGLAKAIVDRAGQSVQSESSDIVRQRGDIGVGKTAVTRPGKLSCSFIIHAVGPIWSNGRNDDEGLLQEAIFNSLEEAGSRQLSSIAIPALSTGIYKYPVGQATKAIVEAIQIYFRDNPSSPLQDVFVCDNNVNTVQNFTKAVEGQFGKSNVQTSNLNVFDQDLMFSRDMEEEDQALRPGRGQQSRGRKGRQFYDNGDEQQIKQTGGSSTIKAHHVIGEIAKEQVDLIVNTTSNRLDLSNGAVSKSLLEVAGFGIQQECNTNYPNGIRQGQFAVTSGGNMSCKEIIHTCLPRWSGGPEKQMLGDLVKNCLRQASRDHCRSVAFPALGTGNLKYPADIVAEVMFGAVDDFSSSNPDSSVQEVKIVLHHRDSATIKAFQDSLSGRGGSVGGGSAGGRRSERKFGPASPKDTTDKGDEGWQHVSSTDVEGVFTVGGVKLTIKQGDLTKERVKCIVNSTNTELDLTRGAVSKELARVGGNDLLDEIALKKNEMSKKGVIMSSAKGLKANYIVHVSTDFFNQDWKKIIVKSLKEAEKGFKVTSVAFPALGTGQYHTSPEDIAQKLMEAVVEYGKSSSAHMITDIRMVIFQKDMLGPFMEAVHIAFSSKKDDKNIFLKAYDWWKGDGPEISNNKGKAKSKYTGAQDSPTVTLYFFSDEDFTIESAIRRVTQHYNENTLEQAISEEFLQNPSASLRRKIEDLRYKYSVQLDYNERAGRVQTKGLTADVVKVVDAVHQIIHETQKQAHETEKANILSNFVQWSYIDNGGSGKAVEYDKTANQTIETAYKDQKNDVQLVDTSGDIYVVDFQKMVEYPIQNRNDTVAVVRKEKITGGGAFELPSQWTAMTSDCELIQVPAGSTEYIGVEQKFTATLGRASNVQQIERVQNKYLWQQYVAKKQQLDNQNQGHQNEQILWHGTSSDAVPSIYKHGFNRSFCGKNAVAIGNGVYFAVNASYSSSNTYSVPDPRTGHKHMFMARVLTGVTTQGKAGLRVPPIKDASRHILFDSVSGPNMYVIFNDTQAYPDYLITFSVGPVRSFTPKNAQPLTPKDIFLYHSKKSLSFIGPDERPLQCDVILQCMGINWELHRPYLQKSGTLARLLQSASDPIQQKYYRSSASETLDQYIKKSEFYSNEYRDISQRLSVLEEDDTGKKGVDHPAHTSQKRVGTVTKVVLEITDPLVNKRALAIALGNLYHDDLEVGVTDVAGVLAVAAILDFKHLVNGCCDIMLKNICCRTVCKYHLVANQHNQNHVVVACERWLELNLIPQLAEEIQLREMTAELLQKILKSSRLFVHSEYSVYKMLVYWLFLQVNPDIQLMPSHSSVLSFFNSMPKTTCFIERDEGQEYAPIFDSVRLHGIMDTNHIQDMQMMNILPQTSLVQLLSQHYHALQGGGDMSALKNFNTAAIRQGFVVDDEPHYHSEILSLHGFHFELKAVRQNTAGTYVFYMQRLRPGDPILSFRQCERHTFSMRPDREVRYCITVQTHTDRENKLTTTGIMTHKFGLGEKTSKSEVIKMEGLKKPIYVLFSVLFPAS